MPSPEKLRAICSIIHTPRTSLSKEEKELLWEFRIFLSFHSFALTNFLRVVNWSNSEETKEALQLMDEWEPPEVDEILELLCPELSHVPEVRRHAVSMLDKVCDSKLRFYLPQLVQAIRYGTSGKFWDSALTSDAQSNDRRSPRYSTEPLANFLITRAIQSRKLTSLLFWQLQCEIDGEERLDGGGARDRTVFKHARRALVEGLSKGQASETQLQYMRLQYIFRTQLQWIWKASRETFEPLETLFALSSTGGYRARLEISADIAELLFSDGQYRNTLLDLTSGISDPFPLPIDPSLLLAKIDPSNSTVISSSASAPMLMACRVIPTDGRSPPEGRSPGSVGADGSGRVKSRLSPGSGRVDDGEVSKKYLYKVGDDLRQDQLVIQIIMLVDNLWKQYGLDLKVTPYKILPFSKRDGLIEFVPGAVALSTIANKYGKGGVRRYLQENQPDETTGVGFANHVLDNFVKSCAGYAIITYLLGIGDRHLDNLLVNGEGNLLHIDFGYMFGQEPKPLAPEIKLSPDMIDAMGPAYDRFRQLCCQAYKVLRLNARKLLTLLRFMSSADIRSFGVGEDVIAQVQAKLNLEMTDELADSRILAVIGRSAGSAMGEMHETAHRFAKNVREFSFWSTK
eukprot:GHVN01055769.1.p1 GENE.GHVN01055769.1~~GHVN01055769.1.p1  ORF type:complete len:627 (+),score=90.59 GHVN01055769.1:1292-3172(+)